MIVNPIGRWLDSAGAGSGRILGPSRRSSTRMFGPINSAPAERDTNHGEAAVCGSPELPEDRRCHGRCCADRWQRIGGGSAIRSLGASAPHATPPRENDPALDVEVLTTERPGGDFMVDVLKTLDFEYVAANPGSSFRGIHECLVNYGGNRAPEFITCCHEESSVAMAHGYFKAEGKPMAVMVHGTVGLQHAAMAIYNAYCDRVPVYILAGNTSSHAAAAGRRMGAQRAGRGGDGPRLHQVGRSPVSLPHFAESAVRAYKIAMTPPMMPVLLVIDGGLQEDPISPEVQGRLRIPKLTLTSPPQGDAGAVAEAARLLVNAQNPVIVADRLARTPTGTGAI